MPLKQVIEALGVDAYIEGSVVVVPADANGPGRVSLNTSLIAAGTGTHLWSETLERPLGDALALEAELARHVVKAVKATITEKESARLTQVRSTSPAAEEAYFQGRYHLAQYGIERSQRALELSNAPSRSILVMLQRTLARPVPTSTSGSPASSRRPQPGCTL